MYSDSEFSFLWIRTFFQVAPDTWNNSQDAVISRRIQLRVDDIMPVFYPSEMFSISKLVHFSLDKFVVQIVTAISIQNNISKFRRKHLG